MDINLFLIINHYLDNDVAKENCAVVSKLKKKQIINSSVIIDILDQSVLKNTSGYAGGDEKLLDHYFAKYKEPIAESMATFLTKAEKYPYIAKQLERYK